MAPTATEVLSPPSWVGGILARVVSDGATGWTEDWGPDGWTPSTLPLSSVLKAPPASTEDLAAAGVPAEGLPVWKGASRSRNPSPPLNGR